MNQTLSAKVKAINLRKLGRSYGEISREIGIAKSSLSYWLKDIALKPEYKKKFYTKRIINLSMGSKSQKERRSREVEAILKQSKEEIVGNISKETFKFIGIALYWAEGSKGKGLRITNSDPYLILFMVSWFEKVFGIKPNSLKAWLNIYQQQDNEKIKKFWSDVTGIPIGNFGKSYIKPLNKDYKKNNLINGWLQGFLQNFDPKVKILCKKWGKLKDTKRPINLRKFE